MLKIKTLIVLKFFRKIRQTSIANGRVKNYLLYAIGEITLVVIGILIAVSINNWNERNKNEKREGAFLINLQQDLKSDSVRLLKIKTLLNNAVIYKRVFEKEVKGIPQDRDSLNAHFIMQYNLLIDFIPNTTTVDQLTNSNGFGLVSNAILRRQIVILYNNYDDSILKMKIGQEKGQLVIRHVSQRVNNIDQLTDKEISDLLEDSFYVNQTRLNFLVTQLTSVEYTLHQCIETLKLLRKELNHA
jgi:hypothetical protein